VSATAVTKELKQLADSRRASDLQRFFKTGPGEYGEGDVFLGLTVPQVRSVARKYPALNLEEIAKLIASPFHEVRLCGLVILTSKFQKANSLSEQKEFFDFYLEQMKLGRINNWDLVDVTAPTIGQYLVSTSRPLPFLKRLARSDSVWERRLAVLFTFSFLKHGETGPTIEISEILLLDSHDLIQKAVGWALREVGKRDLGQLRGFLERHAAVMPRTMLRYSIEKLSESERKKWLALRGTTKIA
jgi:3-methyladenine DNA glycosylase AlkD